VIGGKHLNSQLGMNSKSVHEEDESLAAAAANVGAQEL